MTDHNAVYHSKSSGYEDNPWMPLKNPTKSSVMYSKDLVGFDKKMHSLQIGYTDSRIKLIL